MKFEVLKVIGMNHVYQDRYGYTENTFWVIDGATPLFGDAYLTGNDCADTMQKISDAIYVECRNSSSLEDILSRAVHSVEKEYRSNISDYDAIMKYALPTFAGVMGRVKNNVFEYYCIGDCYISINGMDIIYDTAFDAVNERNKVQVEALHQSLDLTSVNESEEKLRIVQETRKGLNRDYWIGSLDGVGISHGKSGTVLLEDGDVIYAYSDGYEKLLNVNPLKKDTEIDSLDFIHWVEENRLRFTSDDITVIKGIL